MPTIFIRNPETTLATDSSHFTLRSKGRRIGRIAPTLMDQVIIGHGVQVTRTALDRLGATGIPVTFLDRQSRVQARLVPPWKADAQPRLGQARAYFEERVRLQIARKLVDAKLANGMALLRLHASNHPNPQLSAARKELERIRLQLSRATSLESLRGWEGLGGQVWFGVLPSMIRAPWATFTGRTRRPPQDPVNAVLSYSYAVLSHQMQACLEALGLDPHIGYLHTVESRRPNLVLDLMEPFRPVLGDRLMLRLINRGTLRPEHFSEIRGRGRGVFIHEEGRMALMEEFSIWVNSCDETLGPGLPAPGTLLDHDAARFAKAASEHRLEDFTPYYLDPTLCPDPEPCAT